MIKSVSINNKPTVEIDSTTPVDVSFSGGIAIDDSTPIEVEVTNPFQYVYDMVYDGSQWRFQASDSNGKAINLDHTYYTSAEITALGSSTDINLWLSAYNDSMLQYKYVGSYDDEFEVEVYLTHPSLGDGNKCLKLIFDYATENTQKVVKSVYASVVDWTFDDDVTGAISISLGTVVDPDPNNTIPVGQDICTIAVSNTGSGGVTLSLSGVSASLYTLRNVTDNITGSSISYDAAKSYVLETATDYSGQSYSHGLTITATNDFYQITDSTNVELSGTFTAAPTFANAFAVESTDGTNSTYSKLNLGDSYSITLQDNFSYSFWWRRVNAGSKSWFDSAYFGLTDSSYVTNAAGKGCLFNFRNTNENNLFGNGLYARFAFNQNDTDWHHFVVTWSNSGITSQVSLTTWLNNLSLYIDGSAASFVTQAGTPLANNHTFTFDRFTIGQVHNSRFCPSYEFDELALWDGTTLSQTQAQEIYQTGTTEEGQPNLITDITNMPTPTSYFRFENNTNLLLDEISSGTLGSTGGTNAGLGQIPHALTSTDTIYVTGQGTWSNTYYASGDNANAQIKLHADYDLSNDWTISFWVYSAAFSNRSYLNSFNPITSLFTSSHTDATHDTSYPAGIYMSERNNTNTNNPNYFGLTEPSTGSFVGYSTHSDRTYTSGWHNVIVTWDSTYYNASSISQANVKAGLTFYYDNVAIPKDTDYNASGSINPANFIFTGMQFGFHSAAYSANEYNGGKLDGVAIWTSHLVTSTERGHIYNNGTPKDLMNTSGLTSPNKFWLMEDANDLAYDTKNSASNQGSSANFTRTAH